MAFGKGLVAFKFRTKVQVKGLIGMFCLWASSHKLYKEHVFTWFITLKCICQFGMSEKMLNLLNENCKVNEFVFGYSFHLHFPFPTYLPTYTNK